MDTKNIKDTFIKLIIFIIYDVYIKFIIVRASVYGELKFLYILNFSEIIAVVLFLILNYFVYNFKFNSIDKSKKYSIFKAIIFSIVIGLILFAVQRIYYTYVQSYIFGDLSVNSNQLSVLKLDKLVPFFSFISGVIIGPVVEEIFYRQVLFGLFYDLYTGCNKFVRFITSALISGVIFSLGHHGTVFSPYTIVYVIYGVFSPACICIQREYRVLLYVTDVLVLY